MKQKQAIHSSEYAHAVGVIPSNSADAPVIRYPMSTTTTVDSKTKDMINFRITELQVMINGSEENKRIDVRMLQHPSKN